MDSQDPPASPESREAPESGEAPESLTRPLTRKPYKKPQLQVYGNLTDLAKTILGTKTNDGSGHPNKHFTS
jgi:hypothetical protein